MKIDSKYFAFFRALMKKVGEIERVDRTSDWRSSENLDSRGKMESCVQNHRGNLSKRHVRPIRSAPDWEDVETKKEFCGSKLQIWEPVKHLVRPTKSVPDWEGRPEFGVRKFGLSQKTIDFWVQNANSENYTHSTLLKKIQIWVECWVSLLSVDETRVTDVPFHQNRFEDSIFLKSVFIFTIKFFRFRALGRAGSTPIFRHKLGRADSTRFIFLLFCV